MGASFGRTMLPPPPPPSGRPRSLPFLATTSIIPSLTTKLPAGVCSFVEDEETFGKGMRVVYRVFATLYFAVCVDEAESELGIVDLIQVFVETLDRVFDSVCELDIIFNWEKAGTVLDEMVCGGMVVETSSGAVQANYGDIQRHIKQDASGSQSLQAGRAAPRRG